MAYKVRLAFENPLTDKAGQATVYFQRWMAAFLAAVGLGGLPVVTSAWTPGLIANGAAASTTVAVDMAAFGDFVLVSYDKELAAGLTISGNVRAANSVRVTIANNSGAGVTPTAGNVAVSLLKKGNQ